MHGCGPATAQSCIVSSNISNEHPRGDQSAVSARKGKQKNTPLAGTYMWAMAAAALLSSLFLDALYERVVYVCVSLHWEAAPVD